MKNLILFICLLFVGNIVAQYPTNMQPEPSVNSTSAKEKQYIPITYNGKELLGTKKLKASTYDSKGHFKSFLLETLVDSIRSLVRDELLDSLSSASLVTYDSVNTLISDSLANITPTSDYLVYSALLNHESGTSAPTPTILKNTLGTLTYIYDDIGQYHITISGGFDPAKTFVYLQQNNTAFSGGVMLSGTTFHNSAIYLITYDNQFAPVNSWNDPLAFEIRVYP